MNELTFENVNDAPLSARPEFKERYGPELSWWQGTDRPDSTQSLVLKLNRLSGGFSILIKNKPCSSRYSTFSRRWVRSSDIQVPNLLPIENFEWFVGDPQTLARA
jgi:hypothetical protein